MDGPLDASRNQNESRLEDYLNDRLQTPADLEGIDRLLLKAKEQQSLLRSQVRNESFIANGLDMWLTVFKLTEAESALPKATQESQQHESTIREQAEQFSKRQADIDRRLLIITQSETSDEAVRRFESSMEKLRRLDIAKGYVELLQEVESLK